MSRTTPIQTFRHINKPVQEAGVVYRYLDRPSTRLSHGHVDVISEPYHSHQRLLASSVDDDPALSALVHETEYDDSNQRHYREQHGITWSKFKRPPRIEKQTTIELRKKKLDDLHTKRAVFSEISCYTYKNRQTMLQ